MHQPLLSIVIANYNYGRFLEDALKSIFSQSCQDFEVIVVDGGSTDNSVEVIKKYADKIAWWCSEPDKGQSNAFNKGFSRAKGRFLTWVNADDVMLPGAIQELKAISSRVPTCAWIVGGSLWLSPDMKIVRCIRARRLSRYRAAYGLISAWGPSSFFTHELLNRAGGVDESFNYMMDTELWNRFYHILHVPYIPLKRYVFGLRLHPGAKMSGHMFVGDPTADPAHPVWARRRAEAERIQLQYGRGTFGCIKRLLSCSWDGYLLGQLDWIRFHGHFYKDMIPFNREIRLAYYTPHPAPYRDPFLNQLSEVPSIALTVFLYRTMDRGHDFWGLTTPRYHFTQMREILSCRNYFLRYHLGFVWAVIRGRFDVYCWPGFWGLTSCLGILLCILCHRRFGLCIDSTTNGSYKLAQMFKSYVYRRADYFLVPGNASKSYLINQWGVSSDKICFGAYAFDNAVLAKDIDLLRAHRTQIREGLGIPSKDNVFLMVANMIPSRTYPITALGFLDAVVGRSDCLFVMVGKGQDLDRMTALCASQKCLKVIPGCSFEQMKELYAIADVYVHGGAEPASTALMIGAIAGLPLLSSDDVGCVADCMIHGTGGIKVSNYLLQEAWQSAFTKMLENKWEWKEWGEQARQNVSTLSTVTTVKQFTQLLNNFKKSKT